MSSKQREYIGRLPYGLWYDSMSRTEHLFDRGYCGMASRPVDEPWKVTIHAKRHYIGCDSEAWFYSDATSPMKSQNALNRVERVLSKFLLGHDVRRFIQDQSEKPDTGARYLPGYLRPRDPRLDQIAADDIR
jgi:hypothetical protein